MVDLNEPEGFGDAERVAGLERLGRQLASETGQRSGVVEQRENTDNGQPVWVMWSDVDPGGQD